MRGSVTVPSGAFSSSTFDEGFAIQDRSGGIYVSIATNLGLAPRQQVRVTGQLADSFGLLILVVDDPNDVKALGAGPKVAPAPFSTGAIGEATEGRLVAYEAQGTAGLTLKYQGSQPYLPASERQAVIDWIKTQQEWSTEQLQAHIETNYGVVFQSRQSYYQLLADAGITYKQAQRANPKRDEQRIAAKKKRLSLS